MKTHSILNLFLSKTAGHNYCVPIRINTKSGGGGGDGDHRCCWLCSPVARQQYFTSNIYFWLRDEIHNKVNLAEDGDGAN